MKKELLYRVAVHCLEETITLDDVKMKFGFGPKKAFNILTTLED